MALDLNYKPIALVDTSTLTEEEWLAWRKKGIGGSDVAAALHLSPYKTARDLYFDKIGVEPTVEPAGQVYHICHWPPAGGCGCSDLFQEDRVHRIPGSDDVSASAFPVPAG